MTKRDKFDVLDRRFMFRGQNKRCALRRPGQGRSNPIQQSRNIAAAICHGFVNHPAIGVLQILDL